MSEFKKNDLLIMSHFRHNARKNLTTISKETRIPVSTLFNKLKLFETGIIKRHTAMLDFSKLGFSAVAKIMIKTNKKSKIELGKYLKNNHQINSLFKITNGYDFIAEGIFKSIFELENFLETIDEKFKIIKKDVYYVIEDLKREEFMADYNYLSIFLN
jgi:DNA-binding Lrp family transcriptional regulator